jgi:site-specific DNA-cytosine methylase
MNVLSLFDGISCGQLALQRAGVYYDQYFSSEIDEHAIKVTQHNFPNTIHVGTVTKLSGNTLPAIDLLIGGSPCQGFSMSGKKLNFNDRRSKLFFEYVRLKNETNPKYFLMENVLMPDKHKDVISEHLGVEPILINSSLVSAQHRRRLYWTNIPVLELPEDKGIKVSDILLSGKHVYYSRKYGFKDGGDKTKTLSARDYKSFCNQWMSGSWDNENLRMLTPLEYERLQTLPDNYTEVISNRKRYRAIGNCWTVDVISHIFKYL